MNVNAALPVAPVEPAQNLQSAPINSQSLPVDPAHELAAAGAPTAALGRPMPPTGSGLTPEQLNALSSIIPADVIADPVKLAHSIQVLQQLASMGIPTERWPQIMQIMNNQQLASAIPIPVQPMATVPTSPQVVVPAQAQASIQIPAQAPAQPPQYAQPFSDMANLSMQVPQHAPAHASMPVPIQQHPSISNRRSRSRSPVIQSSPSRGQKYNYRQRSPLRSNSELQGDMISVSDPKWTGHDSNLPSGHIKVLSRTLFVGGVK